MSYDSSLFSLETLLLCSLVVHFMVVFIWHPWHFDFIVSKACHCHCALALCRLNLVILRGTHHTALWQGSRLKCKAGSVICLFMLNKGNCFDSCRKVNFSGRTNSLRFQRPSAKGFVQMLACVLSAPSNQGMRGHWAC